MAIKKFLRRALIATVPAKVKKVLESKTLEHANISYSQEGEDMILNRVFEKKNVGFYVDVGAHHPIRFSNTYKFYQKGWRGINIDAMPGSMIPFKQIRSEDVNIECPVSDKNGVLTYFIFNEPALNTFSEELALSKDGYNSYRIIEKRKLNTRTLESILDEHIPRNTQIDFLSVDVEGLDMQVLMSNNWEKYRPTIVLVEDLENDMESAIGGNLHDFMEGKGYRIFARSYNTLFFKERSSF